MNHEERPNAQLRWVRLALLAVLLGLACLVLAPFLAPVAWACILAHSTWPVHGWLRSKAGLRPGVAAALMTAGVGLALIGPILWVSLVLREDVQDLYARGQPWLDRGVDEVLDAIARAPWPGPRLRTWLAQWLPPSQTVREVLVDAGRLAGSELLALLGSVGRNVMKFGLALLVLFFIYRDGAHWLALARARMPRGLLTLFDECLSTAGQATRAITRTVVFVALLQGVLATLAFVVLGLPSPVLLGLATALASVIPAVGTLLVIGPLCIWLLLGGHVWHAAGLLSWGAIVIHPVDNVLRPWLVSNAARLPFLVAFAGVLGGLAAFGLVGVFLGPVILALAIRVTSSVACGD